MAKRSSSRDRKRQESGGQDNQAPTKPIESTDEQEHEGGSAETAKGDWKYSPYEEIEADLLSREENLVSCGITGHMKLAKDMVVPISVGTYEDSGRWFLRTGIVNEERKNAQLVPELVDGKQVYRTRIGFLVSDTDPVTLDTLVQHAIKRNIASAVFQAKGLVHHPLSLLEAMGRMHYLLEEKRKWEAERQERRVQKEADKEEERRIRAIVDAAAAVAQQIKDEKEEARREKKRKEQAEQKFGVQLTPEQVKEREEDKRAIEDVNARTGPAHEDRAAGIRAGLLKPTKGDVARKLITHDELEYHLAVWEQGHPKHRKGQPRAPRPVRSDNVELPPPTEVTRDGKVWEFGDKPNDQPAEEDGKKVA